MSQRPFTGQDMNQCSYQVDRTPTKLPKEWTPTKQPKDFTREFEVHSPGGPPLPPFISHFRLILLATLAEPRARSTAATSMTLTRIPLRRSRVIAPPGEGEGEGDRPAQAGAAAEADRLRQEHPGLPTLLASLAQVRVSTASHHAVEWEPAALQPTLRHRAAAPLPERSRMITR